MFNCCFVVLKKGPTPKMCTFLYCHIKLSFLLTIDFMCLDLISLTSNWVERWPKSTGIFCHHKTLHSVFPVLLSDFAADIHQMMQTCKNGHVSHQLLLWLSCRSQSLLKVFLSSCKNGPVRWSVKSLVSNLCLVQNAPAEVSLRMLRLQQRTADGMMPARAYVWSKLSLLLFMEASLMMLRLWWRTACGIMPAMALRVCNNNNNNKI